ncbi:MAG TPA: hypothetical protein VKE94_17030, partial [Gemmataceae bacterium]|nr:hypothetical protein [Gemmataceae bacterium]
SRKLARPVAVRVKGPTGSGKSFVLEAVGRSMPPESVLVATQITPQALFHMPPDSLRHKLIIAGERSRGKDDEVAEATRALREMISSGRLSKLMPVKLGGELQTVLIEQEGPIAFAESTTMSKVFAEDENRAIGIFTDERTDQTRLVMAGLARGLSGADVDLAQYACGAALLSHGVQRLLARGDVVIPYAPKLADLLPANRVEIRRAFSQLLSLIQASGLLHQYQRERDDNGRLVAGPDDYKLARHLLREPMRRLVGSGPSDPARRFHKRLVGWFGWGSFTTKEAKLKEEASRASVYEWLGELSGAGAVELLEAGRGRMPARWEMRELGHDAEVLPSAAQLFGTDK